jgi:hypothetical protein
VSRFGVQGVRCDVCGKFSRNRTTGEYVRKDGSCGYIWPDEKTDSKDVCDDCLAARRQDEQADADYASTPHPSAHYKHNDDR